MPRRWILVVDDDPLMIKMLEEFLQGPDFTVTIASDAMQSFIQARDLKPALVISDMVMPGGHTGDAALRELRKDEKLRAIPFIFVTGMEPSKAQALLPAGDPTVRLMTKPIDWELLRKNIEELSGIKIAKEDA